MDAGFDPRDVMDKVELERVILPSLGAISTAVSARVDRVTLDATPVARCPIGGSRRVAA